MSTESEDWARLVEEVLHGVLMGCGERDSLPSFRTWTGFDVLRATESAGTADMNHYGAALTAIFLLARELWGNPAMFSADIEALARCIREGDLD